MQHYEQQNSRVYSTVYAYMDTKGRMWRGIHLHSTNKTYRYRVHLINTNISTYDGRWEVAEETLVARVL